MMDKIAVFFKQHPRVANASLAVAAVFASLWIAKIIGISDEFLQLAEAVLSPEVLTVVVIAAVVVWTVKSFEKQIGEFINRIRKVEGAGMKASLDEKRAESTPETVTSPPIADSLDEVIKKAVSGDSEAQFTLGWRYDSGDEIPQDYAKAAEWYHRAAEQGHDGAQNNLGFLYGNGQGVPQNYAKAAELYRRAAEQGSSLAQTNLGSAYHVGKGVPQDLAEAVKWYRRAAGQGNAGAQNNLGVMHDRGEGVPKDVAKASELYRRAAEQNDASAQANLALLHALGEGVPLDRRETYIWLSLAATNGHSTAATNRDNFAKEFSPADLAELQAEAVKRFEEIRRKRAEKGE